jgi:hypothetical protein
LFFASAVQVRAQKQLGCLPFTKHSHVITQRFGPFLNYFSALYMFKSCFLMCINIVYFQEELRLYLVRVIEIPVIRYCFAPVNAFSNILFTISVVPLSTSFAVLNHSSL